MSRNPGGREPMRLRLEGIAWVLMWRLVRLLPERAVYRLFDRLSARSYRRAERRRATVRENLAPLVPPAALEPTVREAFRSYGRYWAETFRMQDLASDELARRFTCRGCENIQAAYDAGTGGVLATPHLGNWDAGGRWVAERWPLTAVAEVLRPRKLFDRFVEHRRRGGITIVPLVPGADVTKQCLERLNKGEMVALVSDRDLSGSGVEVRMFGRRTKLPAGPAVLALRAGAPLIPACIYMEPGGRWLAHVMERIDTGVDPADPGAVQELTQRMARAFEVLIGRSPEQWHAFQRVWLPE